jgi:hypothetical protein
MKPTFKIEKVLESLKQYAESPAPINNIVAAMNQGGASFKNRVFNSEAGTKDVVGMGLGKYSNSYAAYRESKGRQTKAVDLELTGSLRRDIKVVEAGGVVRLIVQSPFERQKVGKLEKLYKKNIFDLNTKEKTEVNGVLSKLISEDIKEILNAAI